MTAKMMPALCIYKGGHAHVVHVCVCARMQAHGYAFPGSGKNDVYF